VSLVADTDAVHQRGQASAAFFAFESDRIARACHAMAEAFLAGGRLLAFGLTAQAHSDVRHVAVEFVHPVIVGKRALPALGVTRASELALLAEPRDIVIAFGEPADGPHLAAAVGEMRRRGCLTIAFSGLGAEWAFEPPTGDPFSRQELVETTYHLLWELVHVFFEHQGRHAQTAGASSFLYPFLAEQDADVEAVIADVRGSVLMKADEVQELRQRTVSEGAEQLSAAAAALRECFAQGGRLLALGNGGSATDAMDLVADLIAAGHPALDLTQDSAIISAIANDIGSEAIFSRQVIAYGRAGDALVALTTSGSSLSVIEALVEARRRGLATVAFVGYDGGRIAAERLADHIVITPSQHIPRIQEAQATAYHVLCTMVDADGPPLSSLPRRSIAAPPHRRSR
jgi:D-sedoheptulose 7-phosphate isomerase